MKEYCIDMPKFCNLMKILPSVDLYFMTYMLYCGPVMLTEKIKSLPKFFSTLNLNRRAAVHIF